MPLPPSAIASIRGKIIAYCPDTGICEGAVHLAGDSDLLIAECSISLESQVPLGPHLNPQDAADIARRAGAKKVGLNPFRCRQVQKHSGAYGCRGIGKDYQDIIVGTDGLNLQI